MNGRGTGPSTADLIAEAADRDLGSTNALPVRSGVTLAETGRSFEPVPNGGLLAGCPADLRQRSSSSDAAMYCGSRSGSLHRAPPPSWWGIQGIAPGSFRFDGGYLLQFAKDGQVQGYLPLLGGALAVGRDWPENYRQTELPPYYASYYGLGSRDSYRYANQVVYRVDPANGTITSVAALLAGDGFVIGAPVPSGYEVYNLPAAYRDTYPETALAWFRYSDGYIYRIDPRSRIVLSADPMSGVAS